MNTNEQACKLAAFLAPLLCGAFGARASPNPVLPTCDEVADRAQPDIDLAIRLELQDLLNSNPGLLRPPGGGSEPDPEDVKDHLSSLLEQRGDHTLGVLWALLAGADGTPRPDILRLVAAPKSANPWRRRTKWLTTLPKRAWDGALKVWRNRAWLQRNAAGCWMNLLIAAVLAIAWWLAWPPPGALPAGVVALALFSIWCLSFIPGWMYIRFLGQRAGALWDEYVLSLHRLGWDSPGRLPRPPVTSQFYAEWFEDHGALLAHRQNIYRQKFDAYYGKSVSETGHAADARVRIETLFPVFLFTTTLAVSWTALLWNPSVADSASSVWDVLKFGFLGAYAFILQMLIRRFFQSDLRPSAYAHAMLRIIVVLIIVTVLYELLPPHSLRTDAVVAFVVGFFPLVGMQALQRCAAAALRVAVPSLSQPYPLNQIDGLTIWYEARLLEAGIEDMQSLATANFVDVILHTRVPVGRLVDWVDQAHLYLQLDRIEHGRFEQWRAGRHTGGNPEGNSSAAADSIVRGSATDTDRAGTQTRTALRQLGIRKATDLLKAFPVEMVDPFMRLRPNSPAAAHLRAVQSSTRLNPAQVRSIVRVLSRNRFLAPVWNWENRGVLQGPSSQPRPLNLSGNGLSQSASWPQRL
jgi:hypothetical protein